MSERRHKLMNAEQARDYLNLPAIATLDWLNTNHGLFRFKVGKEWMYWQDDLDAVAFKAAGHRPPLDLMRREGLKLTEKSA